MVRIAEHRSALPTGPILAVHVRHDGNAEPALPQRAGNAVELHAFFGRPLPA
jgi:hypothetical protein